MYRRHLLELRVTVIAITITKIYIEPVRCHFQLIEQVIDHTIYHVIGCIVSHRDNFIVDVVE